MYMKDKTIPLQKEIKILRWGNDKRLLIQVDTKEDIENDVAEISYRAEVLTNNVTDEEINLILLKKFGIELYDKFSQKLSKER